MRKLIFFVDDDKAILNLLEYTIKYMEDFDVKTFKTGEECLSNLYLKPNLIILDYIFKSSKADPLTGLDTLKEIRKTEPTLPVFILTSMEDDELKEKFINSGATRFVQKNDYFVDTLIDAIKEEL